MTRGTLAEAILSAGSRGLPPRPHHFVSDIHGEAPAFEHLMRTRSGSVRDRIVAALRGVGSPEAIDKLVAIVCYPEQVVRRAEEKQLATRTWWQDKLGSVALLLSVLHRDQPSFAVDGGPALEARGSMPCPDEDALAHLVEWVSTPVGARAFSSAVDALVDTGKAAEALVTLTSWIRRLCSGPLHMVGDVWDRGSRGDEVMETLMAMPEVDIQWGNHDVCWMGAAAGDPTSLTTVLRNNIKYGNIEQFEQGYGISLRPLFDFAERTYRDEGEGLLSPVMKAISAMLFKSEAQAVLRHPEWHMEDRLLIGKMDLEHGTVPLADGAQPLTTCDFPTVDPSDPFAYSAEEAELIAYFVDAFRGSERLQRQVQWLFDHGSVYKVVGDLLLFHGCLPLNEDGTFAQVDCGDACRSGRELLDWTDMICRRAWDLREQSDLDWLGFLWCGWQSTFAGRVVKTFERTYIEDQQTWKEPEDPYYALTKDGLAPCEMILREFGVDPEQGRIVNGHTPVKLPKGQSPIRGQGARLVIDGGFCKAYRKSTGIAGYTLISEGDELRLVTHGEFAGLDALLDDGVDMTHESVVLEPRG